MENRGLVSIVMPAYNCGRFISESIRSVQNQTYPYWELLIIDDNSKDNTLKLIEEFSLSDARIKLLKNEINKGAALSRNWALREASGKWIAFLDADDLWVPEKIEKQISFMIDNDYSFSYTDCEYIDEDGNKLNIYESGPKRVNKTKMYLYNFLSCLTVMYNREKIGLIQIEDLKKRNDYALWLKAIDKADCYLFKETLALYRVRNSGSITDRNNGKIKLLSYHYDLFRRSQGFNPIASGILTVVNLITFLVRRKFYITKVSVTNE